MVDYTILIAEIVLYWVEYALLTVGFVAFDAYIHWDDDFDTALKDAKTNSYTFADY